MPSGTTSSRDDGDVDDELKDEFFAALAIVSAALAARSARRSAASNAASRRRDASATSSASNPSGVAFRSPSFRRLVSHASRRAAQRAAVATSDSATASSRSPASHASPAASRSAHAARSRRAARRRRGLGARRGDREDAFFVFCVFCVSPPRLRDVGFGDGSRTYRFGTDLGIDRRRAPRLRLHKHVLGVHLIRRVRVERRREGRREGIARRPRRAR